MFIRLSIFNKEDFTLNYLLGNDWKLENME